MLLKKKKSLLYVERERDGNCTPFVLCPIPSLLYSFVAPSSLFNSVFGRYALIFPWNFLLMLFIFDFSKIRKAGYVFSLFFSLNILGFFFHPYWKVDGFIVFVFSPRFFCLFSHSIPTRNGAIWWVYYCGILLCFGLGILSPRVKLKTHTHRWWLYWAIQWIRIRIPLPFTIKGFLDIIL